MSTIKLRICDSADAALMMQTTTIPASQIVQVTPSVISAGGNQLNTIGLFVTAANAANGALQGNRVPIGTVQSFSTAASVSSFFGSTSHEAAMAAVYFTGFTNATQQPGSLLFAQMPVSACAAYLRSGPITSTLAQLEGLSGSLSIVVDGYTRTGTVGGGVLSLGSGVTSFTSAATSIANFLNQAAAGGSNQQAQATGSGVVAQQTATFQGWISGNVLTVTSMTSGTIGIGGVLGTAGGISANTLITGQLSITSGTASGGLGTYAVNTFQATGTLTSITENYGILTFGTATAFTGSFSVGQTVTSGTFSTVITGLLTGAGGSGTYVTSNTQTSGTLGWTAYPTPLTCTFDSTSTSFIITSGVTGAASTVAYATGGLATSINMTQATGAVLSQGAAAQTPGTFMSSVTAVTTNWATFTTAFEPDASNVGQGFAQKLAFATWATQAPQNQEFLYVAWDVDPGPTLSTPDTSSFEAALAAGAYNGTTVVYEPSDLLLECFICGVAASINFTQTNGRITFAFKSQGGLTASVTSATVASNLIANGYNLYGAYATASTNFVFLYPGSMPGQWRWIDSYVNQIWLNAGFQNALMTLLTTLPSIPFNAAGYTIVANSLQTQIQAALNFGAIRAGVVLSSTEAIAANNITGFSTAANRLNQTGYFLTVSDPGPTVRQARGSPVVQFLYTDGGAIQQINMSSIDFF